MNLEETRTRQRLSSEERRASIIDAAVSLFSKRGFRGVTTRELAAAVGVSEPVLYQHFETKRSLYDAILESRCQELDPSVEKDLEALSEAGDDRGYFQKLATVLLDWYLADPRYPRLLVFSSLEGGELAQLFYERQVTVFYEKLTGHLERQMERGKLRIKDPMVVARTLAGMIAHHGMIYCIFCPGELAARKDVIVSTVVDIFLEGMMARE
jgi:AcrR family transcriptional regulator